ncbi:MAG: hypothetical protein A2X84_03425 [Desulfuromonadaceae bacterium GWC2_58_13]|nr:MAG: hypothetical protein A2X84_03425 [Desulfuromonadaceae bacterium GWC2_58_13]
MNALRPILSLAAILATTAGSALAAPASSSNHMGIGAWLFIGFCALIFVAQLTPALLLLFGMVKGAFGSKEKTSSTHRFT